MRFAYGQDTTLENGWGLIKGGEVGGLGKLSAIRYQRSGGKNEDNAPTGCPRCSERSGVNAGRGGLQKEGEAKSTVRSDCATEGKPRTQARSRLRVPHSRSLRVGPGFLCDLCVPSSVTGACPDPVGLLKILGLRLSLSSSPKLKTENLPLTTPHTRRIPVRVN